MGDLLGWALYILFIGWCALAIAFFVCFVYEFAQKRKFYAAVCEIVYAKPFVLEKCTESIKNSYDVYRRKRLITVSEPIIDICQEFAMDMRNGRRLDSFKINCKSELADRVEYVIEQIREEEQFDDEKAREIIAELNGNIANETLEKIKRKLTFLEAYHKGVISVKDAEIRNIEAKMKTKKWISWATGTLGVIGSIASIVSLFLTK